MTKESLLKLGLDEETATKVAAASAEELKEYVPKVDHDTAVTAKTELANQLKDRDKDIADLKKAAGDNSDLAKKYGDLETRYKTEKETLEKKLADTTKNNALDMAILQAQGRNPKTVKALLDMDKISVKEDGTLEGLDLETLKKSDPYLFSETKIVGTGVADGMGTGENSVVADNFAKALRG